MGSQRKNSKNSAGKTNPQPGGEAPRSLGFHWTANVLLATLALFAGALFGEKISSDQMPVAFAAIVGIGLALVPVTRHWENLGIEKRRKEAIEAKRRRRREKDQKD